MLMFACDNIKAYYIFNCLLKGRIILKIYETGQSCQVNRADFMTGGDMSG